MQSDRPAQTVSRRADAVQMRRNLGLIAVILAILILYIGGLILHICRTSRQLRRTNREQLVGVTAKLAQLTAYYLAERNNDIRELLTRPEISAYFESQAPAMSGEYSPELSLHTLRRRLLAIVRGRTIDADRIYERIVFLDKDGRVLVDTSPDNRRLPHTPEYWRRFLRPDPDRPRLIYRAGELARCVAMVSTPYRFNGEYAGQIVAWLKLATIERHLLLDSVTARGGFAALTVDGQVVCGPARAHTYGLPDEFMYTPAAPVLQEFQATADAGRTVAMTAACEPVAGTDLAFVRAVPSHTLFDGAGIWEFPVAMGVLAVVILGAVGLVLRSKMQTMVWGARLEEASAQRRWLEDKNLVLEREIAERRFLAAAVEQAAEAIIITDIDGTIEYVNPAFERITGYSPASALGKNPNILKSGKHNSEFYAQMWDTLHNGEDWSGKFTNRRKDGTLYEEDAVISPVRDADGRVVNYVAVKRDVTERVAMEAQLLQSRKMEAIGELAGGIAHDFNNLLTVMLGNCNLLLHKMENDGDRTASENVEEIAKAGHRAASLIRQLLAFSRRQRVEAELIDLRQVVRDSEKLLRRLIRENIQFEVRIPDEPMPIHADPVQVDQIIINLTVNARDAMPSGGTLTLSVSRHEVDMNDTALLLLEGQYVILEVADTGCGMSEEVKARIFEPFFTTKHEAAGTGLGLSTVYGIVKQGGGEIIVDSTPNTGTRFRIYLPLITDAASVRSQAVHAETMTAAEMARDGEGVLLVDDEESVLSMIQHVLRSRGYTVHAALTHTEVMALWEQHKNEIQLLLTDVVMPGMSGIEIGAVLRGDRPDLKVLCMSAYTDSVVVRLGMNRAKMDFLQKPFTPGALLAKVRAVLGVEQTD